MPQGSNWTIRPAAAADLADIWINGAANWGTGQAERYADGIFALFDLLAAYPEMARERDEFKPPVRIHPSGSHLVIYRWEGQGVEIVRILHTHQNLMAYLSDG
jgi:toxin ParE1/3/4